MVTLHKCDLGEQETWCVFTGRCIHTDTVGVCVFEVSGNANREHGVFTGRCIYTDTGDVCVFKVSRNDDFIPLVSLVLLIHFTHV